MSASTEKDNKLNIKEHKERKTDRERERESSGASPIFLFARQNFLRGKKIKNSKKERGMADKRKGGHRGSGSTCIHSIILKKSCFVFLFINLYFFLSMYYFLLFKLFCVGLQAKLQKQSAAVRAVTVFFCLLL